MAEKLQKRYQFFARNGIKWTSWFNYRGDATEPIQLKGRVTLKNEYRKVQVK